MWREVDCLDTHAATTSQTEGKDDTKDGVRLLKVTQTVLFGARRLVSTTTRFFVLVLQTNFLQLYEGRAHFLYRYLLFCS